MSPVITELKATYKKSNEDVWVLNTNDIPLDKEKIKDQQFVYLGPQEIGGNHKHPRTEWFVAVGDLVFTWLDESGEKHEEHMNPDGKLRLVEVPSFLPHAVVNRSQDRSGILFEFADGKLQGVEKVPVT